MKFSTVITFNFLFCKDVPFAPERPAATNVDRTSLDVSWEPPKEDGGSPITGYIVEKRDTSRDRWSPVNKSPIPDTSYLVTGLLEGNQYEFRVRAVNKAGQSQPSVPCEAIKAKLPFGESTFRLYSLLSLLC